MDDLHDHFCCWRPSPSHTYSPNASLTASAISSPPSSRRNVFTFARSTYVTLGLPPSAQSIRERTSIELLSPVPQAFQRRWVRVLRPPAVRSTADISIRVLCSTRQCRDDRTCSASTHRGCDILNLPKDVHPFGQRVNAVNGMKKDLTTQTDTVTPTERASTAKYPS